MERGGGALDAGDGGADLGDAVLEEVHLQIRLLLERLQLLHAQLVQLDPYRARHDRLLAGLVPAAPQEKRRRRGAEGRGKSNEGRRDLTSAAGGGSSRSVSKYQ